jgi:hypothetical protein
MFYFSTLLFFSKKNMNSCAHCNKPEARKQCVLCMDNLYCNQDCADAHHYDCPKLVGGNFWMVLPKDVSHLTVIEMFDYTNVKESLRTLLTIYLSKKRAIEKAENARYVQIIDTLPDQFIYGFPDNSTYDKETVDLIRVFLQAVDWSHSQKLFARVVLLNDVFEIQRQQNELVYRKIVDNHEQLGAFFNSNNIDAFFKVSNAHFSDMFVILYTLINGRPEMFGYAYANQRKEDLVRESFMRKNVPLQWDQVDRLVPKNFTLLAEAFFHSVFTKSERESTLLFVREFVAMLAPAKSVVTSRWIGVGIILAATVGNKAMVQILLDTKHSDINVLNSRALTITARNDWWDIVEILLEQGVNYPAELNSLSRVAASRGVVNIVRNLIDRGVNPSGALQRAANMDVVRAINRDDLIPEVTVEAFYSLSAVDTPDRLKVAEYFINHSHLTQGQKNSIMFDAIWNRKLAVLKMIVENGANLHAENNRGIIFAAEMKNVEMMRYIFDQIDTLSTHMLEIRLPKAFTKYGEADDERNAELLSMLEKFKQRMLDVQARRNMSKEAKLKKAKEPIY